MVSATSWFVFFSLIVAFNITNAQVPYGALAGVGAALESLGPVGTILALESGLPLGGLGLGTGGLPFPAGIPFNGDFPGGFPGLLGNNFQGYPGGYSGPFEGASYPAPIYSKPIDNGFYGRYPGQSPFPTGFEGQPTYVNIPVQDTTQVTESVTVSETTSFPNGYYDASNQGLPFGAPESTFSNGYNGGYFGPYPGQGFSNGNGGITQVLPVPVHEPIFVPEPILVPEPYAVPVAVSAGSGGFPGSLQSGYSAFPGTYPGYSQPGFTGAISSGFISQPGPASTGYPVGPSFPGLPGPTSNSYPISPGFSGPLPTVYPSSLPPSFLGPSQSASVPPQFFGDYCGEYSVGFPGPVPPTFPGQMPGYPMQGPITVIEECDNDNSFSKLLPLILILSLSGNNFC
ncbi:hypothetical protein O0L34_g8187 [Tuta absoluta]|nr:hypothetical protein O0L34_g8187 [Tuta absoluta]